MKRIRTIQADFIVAPPVGIAHFEPVPSFHPPSLRDPLPIPVDDPMETSNRFLDVFKRTSLDTWLYRMEILRHAMPREVPYIQRQSVEMNQAVFPVMNLWGSARRRRGRKSR